jgi:flagellar biosynthesis/type III secretory pathway chaperone
MTEYVYRYSISIFENGYEPVQLCKEIDSSSDVNKIVTRINTDLDNLGNELLEVYFLEELTVEEKAGLDLIIQNHIPTDISDYEFNDSIDLMGNKILNHGTPTDDLDGVNKIYVDQKTDLTEQNANTYTDQIASDILEGRLDFDEAQLDINRLSGRPSGDLVGTTALQELTNKKVDALKNNVLNIGDVNIKEDAKINATKIADGSINNSEFQRLAGVKSNIQTQIDRANTRTDTHEGRTDNPHQVTKLQVGLGKLSNIKSNYDATRMPNTMDDAVAGYSIGSFWINQNTKIGYICTDNKEIEAKWLEITSLGEITQGINVGNGVGVYLDKIGAVHRFRSLIPGDNISFDEKTQDITVKSRDSHSFLLSPTEIEITHDEYRGILFFPWLKTEFGNYRSGKLIFEATVESGSMSVRLKNMTERTILGEISEISESGFYELEVANPPENARVKVEVMKTETDIGSDNPRIFGIVLKYQT